MQNLCYCGRVVGFDLHGLASLCHAMADQPLFKCDYHVASPLSFGHDRFSHDACAHKAPLSLQQLAAGAVNAHAQGPNSRRFPVQSTS